MNVSNLRQNNVNIASANYVKKNIEMWGLLENRLTCLMKIKHSAFLFKVIFLKKKNYIAL